MKLQALILSVGMLVSGVAFSAQSAMASEQGTTRLEKQVTHELNMLPYGNVFDYMTFTVNQNGTVTLIGEVTEPILKSEAGKAARRVEGVERVDNQIKVLPPSFMDARLRMQLYRSIYGEPALQRYGVGINAPIRIIVDNGHVTLMGFVDNQADKIIAGMQAGSVPGIFSLDNQLKIVKG
jgi:hyperosmotically inducible periplasmic protein